MPYTHRPNLTDRERSQMRRCLGRLRETIINAGRAPARIYESREVYYLPTDRILPDFAPELSRWGVLGEKVRIRIPVTSI